MIGHRKALRDAARTAVEAIDFGCDVTILKSWAQGVDADQLPVAGVMTPDERSRQGEKDGSTERSVDLVVLVKMTGGDGLDDDLDAAGALIEAAVPQAIAPHCLSAELAQTQIIPSAEAGTRAASIALTWTCYLFTDPA